MSEFVSRHDVASIEQNYKKTAKTALDSLQYLLQKIEESGRPIESKVGIVFNKGNNHISQKVVDKNNIGTALNPEERQLLEIALTKPQELKGGVIIMVGKEKILDIEDGQIHTDKLKLVKEKPKLEKKVEAKERVSFSFDKNPEPKDKLVADVLELMKEVRRISGIDSNNSTPLPSDKYYFWEKDGQVSISCKFGRGILFNSQGATEAATPADIERFEQIGDYTKKLKQNQVQLPEQVVAQITRKAPKVSM